MNKKKLHSGGDGYSINVNETIGGLPAFSRYSNNYKPIFAGDLLQNGAGVKTGNCNCDKDDNDFIYDHLIKMQGGNKISQFDAIKQLSNNLTPLSINSLKKLITKVFLHNLSENKQNKFKQLGGYSNQLQNILAPLGKNNLLVISALLLLHYFAVESNKNNLSDKKTKKIMSGGNNLFVNNLTKILAPTGINSLGASIILIGIQQAFVQNKKYMKGGVKKIKGGNTLKDLIAPIGTNAFIATGLLIILEKLFTKKVKEIKTDDPIKKKLIGGQLLKKREELFNLIAPLTFNTFAKKSFLKNLSQISNITK